eukprot:CAMPEP_0179028794 /NCGR_PEP_ID=MMETSP0796-20121207/9724_1 /TAXON_ID=73915 /ORGANISM="Pyrodinium bahamense, Strain pbaha01" /LENGTH=903 /DNA_ID=CAMNT_0020724937 /DNA_START=160 /DNA_END=2868 /DNA_ORIENTATION=-
MGLQLHWSVQTNNGQTSWWFGGSDHEFHWIRLTHQPSPWIGDWAFLCFGPQMGGRVEEPVMFFEPWGAKIKPYVFDATLGPDNMRVQLTPTDHGAILKVTFPAVNPRRYEKRVCFKLPPWNKKMNPGSFGASNEQEMWLEITTRFAESVPGNFGLKVRAEVARSSLRHQQDVRRSISTGSSVTCFEFSPMETEVTVWVGTSLISAEQARVNLEREVRDRRFEDVEEESRLVWRSLLSRIDVVDPGPMTEATFRRVGLFYTGLYRALLFPRRLDEVDASGRRVHYSPYDPQGGVHEGILVTDNGFWDTFRTVYPLLALAFPEEAGQIINGWLNAFKEGSWLPEWSSPGYRSCMVGTYADVVVADAVLKGLPGIDTEVAWQAMAKDSFTPGGAKGQGGKSNYMDYDKMGFIPASKSPDSVSGTLDFAFSDFAVSLAAEKLGKVNDAQRLRRRALGAREHLFDSGSGLMLPKQSLGGKKRNDPSQWGDGYVEGSAWHHSFPAYDLPGLAALHGSHEALARKIQELLTAPGTFTPGTYRTTIHEMEEMRALGLGQYGHNNQPVHHILWLLMMLDEARPACNATVVQAQPAGMEQPFCPRRIAEDFIAKVMRKAYGVEFYAGDEDNGEMGAWYVLAALGLFESAPGTYQGYTLGSPVFRRVDLYRRFSSESAVQQVPSLSIRSPDAGTEDAPHVSQVLLNGKDVSTSTGHSGAPVLRWVLSYERLTGAMPGAELHFSAVPASRSAAREGGDEPAGSGSGRAAAGAEAAGAGVAGGSLAEAERLSLQHRIQSLEQQLEAQRRQRSGTQPTEILPMKPVPVSSDGRNNSRQISEAVLQAQRIQIRELERQVESLKHQSRIDGDMNSGLATTVEVAFFILVAVNAVGWFLCIFYRYRSNGKAASGTTGASR